MLKRNSKKKKKHEAKGRVGEGGKSWDGVRRRFHGEPEGNCDFSFLIITFTKMKRNRYSLRESEGGGGDMAAGRTSGQNVGGGGGRKMLNKF